jgi:hypothetical protein
MTNTMTITNIGTNTMTITNTGTITMTRDPFIEWATELDGWSYRPSPLVVPDTRTGFDIDGNYHALLQHRDRREPD